MPNIHVGQTAVRLEFQTGISLESAVDVEIQFYKPNTVLGRFPAQILDVQSGLVFYDVQSQGDLDDTGQWRFWVHITFDDGTELDSNAIYINVYEPGKRYLSHPYGQMSVDGGILMAIEAFRVIYNNNLSTLNADDVQAALDEIKNLIDTLAASDISYDNVQSQLSANNVKEALGELKTITDSLANNLGAEFENTVYVAKNGTDTPPMPGVPLGTIDNPFLTVQAAINSIVDASSTKFYSVVVQPGTYNENLSLKPWVNVIGLTKDGTRISDGGVHTAWFTEGGKITLKGISLGSDGLVATHPQNAPGSSSLSLRNVNLGSLQTNFLGAGVDYVQMRNDVVITGNCTIHSAWLSTFDSTVQGTLRLDDLDSQHPHSNGHDSFAYMRALTLNAVEVAGNTLVEYHSNQTRNTISIDGANAIVQADAASITKMESGTTTVNGGTLEKTTGAYGIFYDNSTSGLTAEDVQAAIDELRTMV